MIPFYPPYPLLSSCLKNRPFFPMWIIMPVASVQKLVTLHYSTSIVKFLEELKVMGGWFFH
jgi:hypothetical protein